MKQETKEEVNKHLEGFIKDYQNKHNLIQSIEMGKWYILGNSVSKKYIGKVSNIEPLICNYWITEQGRHVNMEGGFDEVIREATKEEVEEALIKKANNDYPKNTYNVDIQANNGEIKVFINGEEYKK